MAEQKKNSDSESFRRRREEASVKRTEANAEAKRLKNRKNEAKIAAREKHGGAGMTILLFDKAPAKKRSDGCSYAGTKATKVHPGHVTRTRSTARKRSSR